MSRRSLAARTGAQTTTGGVVVVADSTTIGSSPPCRVAAWLCWPWMAARIHRDLRDTP
jgi:hypothetical protein